MHKFNLITSNVMIKINYQSYGTSGFKLRLRLYQDGETKYIVVTQLLKGDVKKKFWNPKKQWFVPSCPFSEENNSIINAFRQKYEEAAINWSGSLDGFVMFMQNRNKDEEHKSISLHDYTLNVIEQLKSVCHKDGTPRCGYEHYIKFDKRMLEFCEWCHVNYHQLRVSELTPIFVNKLFGWIKTHRKGKGGRYVSQCLHAILVRADKEELVDINDFRKCDWVKKKKTTDQKYFTLSEEQIQKFANLNLNELVATTKNELYRDFCFFMLYTGQSPCDAICLKYSDIKQLHGISHFVFTRRKLVDKQSVPCAVPISQEVESIINKYRHRSKDGYLFPIRSLKRLSLCKTANGDIKHFVGRLNVWLKIVGKTLGCKFPLHTYTFRHTAITRYISRGVPVTYLANMMGTSVENIEKIYYNNQGDISSRNMVLSAMCV